MLERCAAEGVNAGYALGRDYPEHADGLLVAITERRSRADIDRLADVLGRAVAAERGARSLAGAGAMSVAWTQTPQQREEALTIYERSRPGRRAFTAPDLDVPERPIDELLPASLRRAAPPELPEVAEPEIVRHYNRLSKRNFDLDTGFYPLGSCTMKHNPKLHERVAALPGNARLHPLQAPARAQGALELMWNLERALAEISGLPHVSLQPSAGSHGELAGVLLTRAYHADRGDERTLVLTPDTAHGTNPATVTMAGYEVVKVGTAPDGGVDLEDLRRKADDRVACLMLTNPNTLGLFDPNIEEIARIAHDAGATLYYDGANLNAVMGISRPGDMGFDIVHFNLHKSFTQPHGGGGPGAGPIAVSDRIEPYLMVPRIVRREPDVGDAAVFDLDEDRPKSIGRLRGFQGNYGVFVRSYAYICSLGGEGLREASEIAVLNANYLMALLRRLAPQLPAAFGDRCMHEFVLSGAPMKRDLGIRTTDLAKRLLDFGYHPPTVYFPLLVEEALLVEPTETETRETLEAFAEVVAEILREAADDPEIARNAPYSTPVRRLDEAAAARTRCCASPRSPPGKGRARCPTPAWSCSAAGRPATSPRCGPPSSGRRPCWSSATCWAAPASTAAASPPRRCSPARSWSAACARRPSGGSPSARSASAGPRCATVRWASPPRCAAGWSRPARNAGCGWCAVTGGWWRRTAWPWRRPTGWRRSPRRRSSSPPAPSRRA